MSFSTNDTKMSGDNTQKEANLPTDKIDVDETKNMKEEIRQELGEDHVDLEIQDLTDEDLYDEYEALSEQIQREIEEESDYWDDKTEEERIEHIKELARILRESKNQSKNVSQE